MENITPAKDLILGMVMNYDWRVIEPFFVSLRRTGFTGDVAIFVSNISDFVLKKLNEYGVTTIPFQRVGLEQIISPNDYRYYLYRVFLGSAPNYRFVMITDVRDVIFQDFPFQSFVPEDKISVAVESKTKTIYDDACNTRWLLMKFGTHIFYEICSRPIICSGTTIAPAKLMCHYLDTMIHYMFLYGGYYKLIDQGVHNYIIYTGKIGPIAFMDNNSRLFLTLGLEDHARINSNGKIEIQDKAIAPIVHQYDRHKELVDFVNLNYRG